MTKTTDVKIPMESGSEFSLHSQGAIKISSRDGVELSPRQILKTITDVIPDDENIMSCRFMGGRESVYLFDHKQWEIVVAQFPHVGETIHQDYPATH